MYQNTFYISTVYFPCLVSHFNYWLVVGFIEREETAAEWRVAGGATFGTIYDTGYFGPNSSASTATTIDIYYLHLVGHFLINRIDLAVVAQPCNFPT